VTTILTLMKMSTILPPAAPSPILRTVPDDGQHAHAGDKSDTMADTRCMLSTAMSAPLPGVDAGRVAMTM
jgi:hypothetical protein